MNRPKKLVSHVVVLILQEQSISDTWIFIAAIRNREPNKFFVKGSSNGTKYMVIINHKKKTFKNDVDNNAMLIKVLITYNLHSFNKDLPYCQCIDWQRFQLQHMYKHIYITYITYI